MAVAKIIHNWQVYMCSTGSFIAPPGFITYQREFGKITDNFMTKYELLMSTPVFSNDLPENHNIIARIYTMERLMLSHIGAHGSMYKSDKKRDSGQGSYTGILNADNFKLEVTDKVPLENQKDYKTDWTDFMIDYINNYNWADDYESYRFLHNVLSKHSGRCHGVGAKGISPYKGHQNNFSCRYLKGVLSGTLETYNYNLKRLKTTIENKIALQKFNVIELQGGFVWLKQGNRWFLQIEVWMTSRYGHEITDMKNALDSKFADTMRYHSEAIMMGQDTFQSIISMTDSNQSEVRVLSEPDSNDSLSLKQLNLNESEIVTSGSQMVLRNRFKTSTQKDKVSSESDNLSENQKPGPSNKKDYSIFGRAGKATPKTKPVKRKLDVDQAETPKRSKKLPATTTLTQHKPKPTKPITARKPVGVKSAFQRPRNVFDIDKDSNKENEGRYQKNRQNLDRLTKRTAKKNIKINISSDSNDDEDEV